MFAGRTWPFNVARMPKSIGEKSGIQGQTTLFILEPGLSPVLPAARNKRETPPDQTGRHNLGYTRYPMSDQPPRVAAGNDPSDHTAFRVLGAISFSRFLNGTLQSLMIAIYPLLKTNFQLSFAQIGLITFAFQFTASLLQPVVGYYTDRHPRPFSLAVGMSCTFTGLLTLSLASTHPMLLLAAALVGSGSAVFHPESSRVARMQKLNSAVRALPR